MTAMSQSLLVRATLPATDSPPAPAGMLVFAHPDDEVIGLGARLARYRSAVVVHVTDGAPQNQQEIRNHGFTCREDYAACRRSELQAALKLAGLRDARTVSFQIPDQEASLHLAYLVRELHNLQTIYAPEVVFTHPYEGGHPDHDACAFAVHRAVSLARMTGERAPALIEAAFYHLGTQGIETGCFAQHHDIAEEIEWPLSSPEQKHKQDLLACFSSQQEMLRYFSLAHERFRVAPRYNFHEPPHAGRVFYEHYAWGMSAQRFCELARQADAAERACH